ncbi:hypothetical protein XANCAGTX0491_003389 [Xanthoria calcicola]
MFFLMIFSLSFVALVCLTSSVLAVPTTERLAFPNSTNVTAEPIAVNATAIAPHARITARQWNIGFPDLGHPFCYVGVKPIDVMLSRDVEKAAHYLYSEAPEIPRPVKGHKHHYDIYFKDDKLNVQVCVSSRARRSKGVEVGPVDMGYATRAIFDLCCRGTKTCGGGTQIGMSLDRARVNVIVNSAKGDRCPE